MYIANGYVRAGIPEEGLKVSAARVVGDLCMLVTFSTGETRLFDASELLGYEVFAPLAEPAVFESYVLDRGVLTWCNGDIDIAPEGLYNRTYEYATAPLAM